jgi:hypothetical protein
MGYFRAVRRTLGGPCFVTVLRPRYDFAYFGIVGAALSTAQSVVGSTAMSWLCRPDAFRRRTMERMSDDEVMREWHRWRDAAHNAPKSIEGQLSNAWAANSRRWAEYDRERVKRNIPFPAA